MKAGEVKKLHLVESDHTLLNLLVPAQPCLLLVLQFLKRFLALNRVVLAVHRHEVTVQRNSLHKGRVTMMSFGVNFALE